MPALPAGASHVRLSLSAPAPPASQQQQSTATAAATAASATQSDSEQQRKKSASNASAGVVLPHGAVADGAQYQLPAGYYLLRDGTVVCPVPVSN
jgi:hypothetical protein